MSYKGSSNQRRSSRSRSTLFWLMMVLAVSATQSRALYRRGALWPVSPDGITRVPVCFLTSGDNTPEDEVRLRTLVREAIEATWGRWARIQFSGFGECSSPPANATLAIMLTEFDHDGKKHTGGAGDIPDQRIHLSGQRGFQGSDTPLYGWMQLNGVPYRHAWAVVTHEVGHALSFEHEQSRPDAVGLCPNGDSIIEGGTVLTGEYDDISVMNYCLPYDSGRLSRKDIQGVQSLYGTSAAGRWLNAQPVLSHIGVL